MKNMTGQYISRNNKKKAAVLVTGMSGTGKSTVLIELARRGHRVIDTDYNGWSEEVELPNEDGSEWLWNEKRIEKLLTDHSDGFLFISGCVSNQAKFYPKFNAIVLLSAPLEITLERVATRKTNNYGKTDEQREQIIHHTNTIEPLLRAGATAEIDTRKTIDEVADELEIIANMAK